MAEAPSLEDWRAAFGEFERLIGLDSAAQNRALEELRITRPQLYPHVSTLLASSTRTQARTLMLGESLGGAAAPGQRFGDYTLERQLGAGGMGEVWLAQRNDGLYQGHAAVKLLHPYLASSNVRDRFAREGQILGRLSHPHIARLLDAGVAANGALYLVLEHVQGSRIDQWCDEQRLNLSARLRLLLQVCDAVTHAHAHLVIHRDLKPSNIFVTPEGEVKLLDFGIAKLVEQDNAASDELTRIGGRALTPEYAAPEQLRGDPASTAADVYALGVLMYVLLSGQHPYARGGLSVTELEKAALETTPLTMSRLDSDAMNAELRATTLPALRKALAGDLDAIAAKALRKEPAERYGSVAALADELRRYLNHEPVQARAESFAYHARKFIRRNRLAVVAAASLLLTLCAGIAGVLWQARQTQLAAERATAQQLRAERVKEFLVSVFREQDSYSRGSGTARSPLQMVQQASARLDAELAQEPEVRNDLVEDLGEIRINLGDTEAGVQMLKRAVQDRIASRDAPARIAETQRKLAHGYSSQDQWTVAAKEAQSALQRLAQIPDADPVLVARLKASRATSLSYGRDTKKEALQLLQEAQGLIEAQLGRDAPEAIDLVFQRGQLLEQARRDTEATPLLQEAITRYETALGADSVRLMNPLQVLGVTLKRQNRFAEARQVYLRALNLGQSQLQGRHPDTALIHLRLAAIDELQLNLSSALEHYVKAEALLPEAENSVRSELLINRGQLLISLGKPVEAERDLRGALDLRRATMGLDNGLTWFTASEWGQSLAALGRLEEAEKVQREAVAQLIRVMGPEAYQNALLIDQLARTLEARKAPAQEIVDLRQRSLDLTITRYPETHTVWAERAVLLARGLRQLPGPEPLRRALDLLQRAVLGLEQDLQKDPAGRGFIQMPETLIERAEVLRKLGEPQSAVADLQRALDLLARQPERKELLEHAKKLLRASQRSP